LQYTALGFGLTGKIWIKLEGLVHFGHISEKWSFHRIRDKDLALSGLSVSSIKLDISPEAAAVIGFVLVIDHLNNIVLSYMVSYD
jgi:hypothetical protein